MRLSTRVRYGSRAMLDLALHYGRGPISLREVCERQEVSESYLENLMTPLRVAGLVRTERGYRGGYVLARDPSQITLGDVVRALEGSLAPVPCVDDNGECQRAPQCVPRIMWERLRNATEAVLDGVTLAGMARMQEDAPSQRTMPAARGTQQAGQSPTGSKSA